MAKRTNWKKLYELEKEKAKLATTLVEETRKNINALLSSDVVLNIHEKIELTDALMKNVKILYIAGGTVDMNLKKPLSIRVLSVYGGNWNLGTSTLNLAAWDYLTKESQERLVLQQKASLI